MTYAEKREQILIAFRYLHDLGLDDVGLADLARIIDLPWVRVRGVPATGALKPFINRMMDEGIIRRRAQGKTRGRYKLIEEI